MSANRLLPRLRRPREPEIAALLADGDAPVSYAEVEATRAFGAPLPRSLTPRYDLDLREFVLGHGGGCFERAREALAACAGCHR